jgi:hypothetical protein
MGTVCLQGVCGGGQPTICQPADECHDVGTCDQATGACSNPVKLDGTACASGNACIVGTICTAGVCGGGKSTVCTPSDQCHDVGTCDPATGVCSNPAKQDGAPCAGGICQAGVCKKP